MMPGSAKSILERLDTLARDTETLQKALSSLKAYASLVVAAIDREAGKLEGDITGAGREKVRRLLFLRDTVVKNLVVRSRDEVRPPLNLLEDAERRWGNILSLFDKKFFSEQSYPEKAIPDMQRRILARMAVEGEIMARRLLDADALLRRADETLAELGVTAVRRYGRWDTPAALRAINDSLTGAAKSMIRRGMDARDPEAAVLCQFSVFNGTLKEEMYSAERARLDRIFAGTKRDKMFQYQGALDFIIAHTALVRGAQGNRDYAPLYDDLVAAVYQAQDPRITSILKGMGLFQQDQVIVRPDGSVLEEDDVKKMFHSCVTYLRGKYPSFVWTSKEAPCERCGKRYPSEGLPPRPRCACGGRLLTNRAAVKVRMP